MNRFRARRLATDAAIIALACALAFMAGAVLAALLSLDFTVINIPVR